MEGKPLFGPKGRWWVRHSPLAPARLLQQGRCMSQRGLRFPAEHSRDLFISSFARNLAESRMGPSAGYFLRHHKMRGCHGSHLRQMGDAEHLMVVRELSHFGADGISNFATNVCIDLIKNEKGDRILFGQRRFDGEHQP